MNYTNEKLEYSRVVQSCTVCSLNQRAVSLTKLTLPLINSLTCGVNTLVLY